MNEPFNVVKCKTGELDVGQTVVAVINPNEYGNSHKDTIQLLLAEVSSKECKKDGTVSYTIEHNGENIPPSAIITNPLNIRNDLSDYIAAYFDKMILKLLEKIQELIKRRDKLLSLPLNVANIEEKLSCSNHGFNVRIDNKDRDLKKWIMHDERIMRPVVRKRETKTFAGYDCVECDYFNRDVADSVCIGKAATYCKYAITNKFISDENGNRFILCAYISEEDRKRAAGIALESTSFDSYKLYRKGCHTFVACIKDGFEDVYELGYRRDVLTNDMTEIGEFKTK